MHLTLHLIWNSKGQAKTSQKNSDFFPIHKYREWNFTMHRCCGKRLRYSIGLLDCTIWPTIWSNGIYKTKRQFKTIFKLFITFLKAATRIFLYQIHVLFVSMKYTHEKKMICLYLSAESGISFIFQYSSYKKISYWSFILKNLNKTHETMY